MKPKDFTIYVAILFIMGLAINVPGQIKQSGNNTKLITADFEDEALGEIFKYLIEKHGLVIGLELTSGTTHFDFQFGVNLEPTVETNVKDVSGAIVASSTFRIGCRPGDHPITLKVQEASVKEVFDTIVPQMKDYKWEMRDGAVNIYPIRDRDKRLRDLLDIKVSKFSLRMKEPYVLLIAQRIYELPEVEAFKKSHGLGGRASHSGIGSSFTRRLQKDFAFSNLTFRELLNRSSAEKKGGCILKIANIKDGSEVLVIDI